MTTPTASEVWRKYATDHVPASGPHKPDKTDIIAWGLWLESLLAAGVPGLAYETRSAIDTDLAHDANSSAMVYGDATAAYNGIYRKIGASGVGSWTRIGDLPSSVIRMTVTGGTANAIIATAPETPSVPGNKLYLLTPTLNTTSASTLALNGQAAVPIKTAVNGNTVTDSLVANLTVLMAYDVDHYTLLVSVPTDANSVLASAVAAQAAAEAAAVSAAASAAVFAPDPLFLIQNYR